MKKFNIVQILLFVIVAILAFSWVKTLFTAEEIEADRIELKHQLKERDRLIAEYERIYNAADSSYKAEFKKIDSIQHLIHENDSITFNFSADSIQKLWAKRFGHH
jgi:chromosome condensin MukBEF ATPase and DNA-binding subunit MukB